MTDEKPNNPSSDYTAMEPYWKMTTAILGGVKAMRDAGKEYLPKFEAETETAYKDRLGQTKLTNIFRDILENLSQKPFSTEVNIADEAPQQLRDFCEDVDGDGNNLHVFAGSTFFQGIAYAVDWILVDYTHGAGEGATVAQERAAGVRPYWCRYPATSVLAAYSAKVSGKEEFIHVRLAESVTEHVGWKEVTKERIRVLDREVLKGSDGKVTGYGPATWTLYEKQKNQNTGAEEWFEVGSGNISIGVIPIVPFITGRRRGRGWRFHPPMRDAAELQIEHYQQENALKNAKNLTAFPMLAGNGVSPETGDNGKAETLVVGPATVLYAPNDGQSGSARWEFVEPSATSLTFLASDIKATAQELRELGRQPLTAQSGNLTVVTTAFAAQKGNSAIQAWALNLKDALENALRFTAMWLRLPDTEATVDINTDFDIGIGDDETFGQVIELYREGTISREALIHEGKRRGIIDRDYEPDDDLDLILKEMEDRDEEEQSTIITA